MANGKLILLRHGQSEWNASNQFTGWVDVDLTEKGEAEAKRGGELLKESGILPEVVYTSLQRRAIRLASDSVAWCRQKLPQRCCLRSCKRYAFGFYKAQR